MRVDRLVIEAGDNTLGVDFHEKLTVIAGVGRLEREGLMTELIGAMSAGRSGVHLEMVDHLDRHLAVFRPTSGRHRVVDTDHAVDVTEEFTHEDTVDVLATHGLDARTARQLMRLTATDLRVVAERDEAIAQLASVDQQRLWRAADRMAATGDHLRSEAGAVGSAPEDVEIIEQIEERHREHEASIARYEVVRRWSFIVAGFSGLIGTILSSQFGGIGLGVLVVGVLAALAAVWFRHRVVRAQNAEEEALAKAGAQSYLGFHLQRVNGLLSDDHQRKRLMEAADSNREAQREWYALAGDIPVEFALEQRDAVQAAVQLRRNVDSLDALSPEEHHISRDDATDLAQVLVTRLSQLRNLAGNGTGLPLVLDEPFTDVEAGMKALLLELLTSAGGHPQVIVLTEDEDVASWARLEALTGELSIIEPTPEPEDRTTVG